METAAEKAAAKAAAKAKKDAEKAAAEAAADAAKLEPKAQGQDPVVETPKGADLDFAVNVVKLNRAKGYVQKLAPNAKGAEFAQLVKARYVEMGGLLNEDKSAPGIRRGKMTGRIVNLADNDGSKD